MNDKENDGDADAGIGHVERRPRMRERHMEIEQQEIDHVSVKHAVSQVPEHAGNQKRERSQQRATNEKQRFERKIVLSSLSRHIDRREICACISNSKPDASLSAGRESQIYHCDD